MSPSELLMPLVQPHKSSLYELLSCLLPTETQTWLLHACLWSGEPGRRAWEMWQQSIGEPIYFFTHDDTGSNALLPLLFVALRDNHAAVDAAFQTRLRTAYMRDELRNTAYRRVCQQVLLCLTATGVEPIVLKGAALADSVYPDPVLQHAHTVDLLLRDTDLSLATRVLPPVGFAPLQLPLPPGRQAVELSHQSGLPLVLHRRLFRSPFYDIDPLDLWARSQVQHIAEVPARVLSPADTLLQLCVDALSAKHHDVLRWVCDSWFLLKHAPDLDWDVFLDNVQRCHLTLPVTATLGYLAEAIDASVPDWVLARLSAPASPLGLISHEAAIADARTKVAGGIPRLLQLTKDWPTRGLILKWLFFPSLRYLRVLQPLCPIWLLPVCYVSRPLKYAASRLWGRAKRRRCTEARI